MQVSFEVAGTDRPWPLYVRKRAPDLPGARAGPRSIDRMPGMASTRRHPWTALAAFVALCLGVGALGGLATARSVATWYPTLAKPAFTPPDAVFGPVWTVLYLMIAVAGWRVWRKRGLSGARAEFFLYATQLALNLGWSMVFFGLRAIGPALAEIAVLLAAVIANAVAFWRIDRPAGALLTPYAVWVSFAAALNFAIWRLN